MKIIQTLLVCLFSLTLIVGCGDIEDASDSVNPSLSVQALPADDDIQGLYNMRIPPNWDKTEDPVLYTKYFRAKLLRQFGNRPEVHIIADMELRKRQQVPQTHDEHVAYLEAHYRLFQDKETLEKLKVYRQETPMPTAPAFTFGEVVEPKADEGIRFLEPPKIKKNRPHRPNNRKFPKN